MVRARLLVLFSIASLAFAANSDLPRSPQYEAVQKRLASGWNTWDVHSVAEQVLLPDGVGIRVGVQHNSTLASEEFLGEALIGRQAHGAEQVFPGPHSWNGSYTELRLSWHEHNLRIQSAHAGDDLVLLVTPLAAEHPSNLPPTVVFSAGFLWNRPGSVSGVADHMEAHGPSGAVRIYFAGLSAPFRNLPVNGPYFAAKLSEPAGVSTGKARSVAEIQAILAKQRQVYEDSIAKAGSSAPVADAIETTLGWDTIFEPEHRRVVSPVSRVWSEGWGGYVIFDWDTFFAASLAAIGSRDLAYADALETLRESTPPGFVPNYARAGDWKSSDRSEPPVGAITVLDLYRRFQERWFLEDAFAPLLAWNRWWNEHRSVQNYLVWGSDGDNQPVNLDDDSRGTRQGAIFESGLDNSPMYDTAVYDSKSHHLLMADVGLLGMYIADCDALATIAETLGKGSEASELRGRSSRYRAALLTLWNERMGMFLNKDLRTGEFSTRLSPTNFYPLLARAATPAQAGRMINEHLLNPKEFWGEWVIPSIARDDPGFKDQEYWRGRIWGPMNYLVYLGLRNYARPEVRRQFAQKSLDLFLREWRTTGHVHENYNTILGTGDDVSSSDRFYHWGALLGLIEYREQTEPPAAKDEVK